MYNKFVFFFLLGCVLQLSLSLSIEQRGNAVADVDESSKSSSSESSEELTDAKLDEMKKNLTSELPPGSDAAKLVGSIVDKLKNGTSHAQKLAGLVQLLFVPTIVENADNATVISTLHDVLLDKAGDELKFSRA